MSRSILFRFRQPQYTGENRCLPCTGANVVIAGVLSLAVAYAWASTIGPLAWFAGTTVFAAGLVTVWLRGYLVPGTPELTKQHFPDRLLRLFDKDATPDSISSGIAATVKGKAADAASDTSNDSIAPEDVDADALLLSAGVVTPCEQEDDLCLDEGFRVGWYDRMQRIHDEATEREDLARELDVDQAAIEFEEYDDDAVVAHDDDRRLGQWESRAALVADLAAARELPNWVDDWDAMAVEVRSQLLGGLRIFLDACPACEGPVETGTETVESCCTSHDIVAASCEDCDVRLLEIQHPEAA